MHNINKFSNNVMARQLFLSFGAISLGARRAPTSRRAPSRSWLESRRLAIPELVLENGSGLSRSEHISARSLAQLLLLREPGVAGDA